MNNQTVSTQPSAMTPSSPFTSTAAVPTAISAVGIKAPAFTERTPAAWFRILEAQFHLANINRSETKFYHALAALPPDLVSNLSENVLNTNDYGDLRKAVCDHHEATKPELLDRFLTSTPMTGRPSHYLSEMQRLGSQIGANDDLIRHKFIQVLPPNIAPLMMTLKGSDLDDLGRLADELVTMNPIRCGISALSKGEIQQKSKSLGNHKSISSSHTYTLQPFSSNQRPKVCRWHIYFGGAAKKCRTWCQWPNKQLCTVVNSRSSSPCPSEN
jgi:hypothetical protein